MNATCQHIDDLLLDGSPEALERAAAHARGCAECAENLAAWNEISATAKSMKASWTSDLLWPRIERSLRAERRRSRTRLWQIAAAVVMTVGIGGGTWWAVQQRAQDAAFDKVILKESALEQVESAEKAHLAAIEQLEKVAGEKVEQPTALMVSYREKLMLLDDAIAECQTAIEQNRQNAHLRKQLLAIYSEKHRTLQEILREGTNVSNP